MKKFLNKVLNIILTFVIIINIFIPYITVKAANEYEVSVVKSDGSKSKIGSYSDYSSAKNAMNNHNSDNNNVACIYYGGNIINCKYAVVNLLGSSPISLYKNVGDSSAYTSTHPSYGRDAAFIDYDQSKNRVKIAISGFFGWTAFSNVEIVPLSLMGTSLKVIATNGINARSGHNTSSSSNGVALNGSTYNYYDTYDDGTYTWYKINYNGNYSWIATKPNWISLISGPSIKTYYTHYKTGNLLHYYRYSTSSQSYTNLGPSPSYLTEGKNYYSFDGNYFYESLIKMLDDYKNDTHSKAVNSNKPHYAYYLYLTNHTRTGYTADDFNQVIINKGYKSKKDSMMYGEGSSFIESQETYGVNALLTFSAAINESATGTSEIARDKNNLFGHGAYDSCPYSCATTYSSVREGILAHARMTGDGYNDPNDWRYFGAHYGNKGSGMNVKYATDPYWGEKAAANAFLNDYNYGLQDYNSNTIGIKYSSENVPVKKSPSDSSGTIYTLKNKSFSVPNIPVVVTDKVYSNNEYWYKIYTDVALNDKQEMDSSVDYKFEKSYGYVKASYLYVGNSQPEITASDVTVSLGDKIDPLSYAAAKDTEDGDISKKLTYSGTVDTSKEGSYKITYTVEDSARFKNNKTVTFNVVNNNLPEITASDKKIKQYKEFNPLDGVSAKDLTDGNITNKIIVTSNTVNINKVGTYKVNYSVTNSKGKTVTKEITVEVIGDDAPVISASDKSILLNSSFTPLDGVSAKDAEDGNLTSKIEVVSNNVDTSKVGAYQVSYKVVDSANHIVTKIINVKVVEKVLDVKDGLFYLDYIKEVDGSLQIKGYNTISGINNNLDENIEYKILFENIDTKKVTEFKATRITNKVEFTRTPYSEDGKDYTYSWFKYNFDLDKIEEGNYKIYVVSESSKYYSKNVISNKLYKEQATYYKGSKSVITSRDFNDKTGAIEFKIRKNSLANKSSSYTYNQYDTYRTFEFSDNKLHLMGLSYSYGADLSSKANVTRSIIFENMDTFETYKFDLGSITTGLYKAVLPVDDKLDKTRAWYDAKIDISSIPKGNYVIYITTTSNITDIAELTEKLGRSLDKVTSTINNKNYSFKINYDRGNRIELIVK